MTMVPKPAIVILDPVTEWKCVIEAARRNEYDVVAVQLSPVEERLRQFVPTSDVLKELVSYILDDVPHCDV